MKGRLLDMGKPYPVSVYSVHNILDHFFPKGRRNFKSYEGHEIIRFVLVNCERTDFSKKGINLHLLNFRNRKYICMHKWIFCSFLKLNRGVSDKYAPNLESGIIVAPRINVAPGNFGKKNKHSPIYILYLYY